MLIANVAFVIIASASLSLSILRFGNDLALANSALASRALALAKLALAKLALANLALAQLGLANSACANLFGGLAGSTAGEPGAPSPEEPGDTPAGVCLLRTRVRTLLSKA